MFKTKNIFNNLKIIFLIKPKIIFLVACLVIKFYMDNWEGGPFASFFLLVKQNEITFYNLVYISERSHNYEIRRRLSYFFSFKSNKKCNN